MFKSSNSTEYYIFNYILYSIQIQKANGDYVAFISLDEIRKIINNKNIATVEKITDYFNDNFRKETIKWKFEFKTYCVGLITKIIFDENSNKFSIVVDEDLVDFILNYKKKKTGYTPINLEYKSKNFYAVRLYEYLRKWSNNNSDIVISLIDLRILLRVENLYPDFKIFKRDLLNKAVKEIKEKFNMHIDFIPIKSGRKVVSLKFIIKDNEPRQYNFTELDIIDTDFKEVDTVDNIKMLLNDVNIKIVDSTINSLKRKYGENLLFEAIKILHIKRKQVKIKAPVSYLKGILENLSSQNENNLGFTSYSQTNYDLQALEKAFQYGLENGQTLSDFIKK